MIKTVKLTKLNLTKYQIANCSALKRRKTKDSNRTPAKSNYKIHKHLHIVQTKQMIISF